MSQTLRRSVPAEIIDFENASIIDRINGKLDTTQYSLTYSIMANLNPKENSRLVNAKL